MSKQQQIEEEKAPLVQWSTLKDVNILTADDVKRMQDISQPDLSDENTIKNVAKTIFENSQDYAPVLFKILNGTKQEDPIRFVLYVLDAAFEVDSLEGNWRSLKDNFLKVASEIAPRDDLKIYESLLKLIDKEKKPFIVERAFKIISKILDYGYRVDPRTATLNTEYESLLYCITTILRESKEKRLIKAAISALSVTIRKEQCRDMFYSKGGIPFLFSSIDMFGSNVQVIYEITFSIWVLSFSVAKLGVYFQDSKVVPKLHMILKNVQTEKVIRVILSTFKNFISNTSMLSDMVNLGVPKTLFNMEKRNFEDEDIRKDVHSLRDALEQHIEEITSFDEYRQEVLSGNLDWSPVHNSEKFWKENIQKFEEHDYYILQELIKLLDIRQTSSMQSPAENETPVPVDEKQQVILTRDVKKILQIACHDIGQFVRYHPQGRKLVTKFGGKDKVIQLMGNENEDAEVKKYALMATQKIMITNWDYLEKQ